MATTETIARPPVTNFSDLSVPEQQWLRMVQNLHPLEEVDTTTGPYSEPLPPAGLLGSNTGATNQNMERTYKKVSVDGNTFTLTGSADGVLTLTAPGSFLKVKSNGTVWRKTG